MALILYLASVGGVFVFASVFGVFGLFLTVIGVARRDEARRFAAVGVIVDGLVVDNQTVSVGHSVVFRAVIRFPAGDRDMVLFDRAKNRSSLVGTVARVRYNPADPTDFEILDGGPDRYDRSVTRITLGVVMLVVAVVTVIAVAAISAS